MLDGGKHGGIEADALERGVSALPLGERFHELGEVAAGLGIEAVRGAEFHGDGEARVLGVDGDDLRETRNLGGLQRQEANHTGAHDDGGVAWRDGRESDGMHADRDGLDHRGFGETEFSGKFVENAGGDGDKFGEGAVAAIVAARDAKDLTVIAEIDVSALTMDALATEDRGVEGHAIALSEAFYLSTDAGDDARGLMAHNQRRDAAARGAVVAVDVGTADPAGADLDQHILRTTDRISHVHVRHLLIFGKEQGFHRGEEGGFWQEGQDG